MGPKYLLMLFSQSKELFKDTKTRIKSRKDPFTNSGNVLMELASSRWIERIILFGSEEKSKIDGALLNDDEENEYEV